MVNFVQRTGSANPFNGVPGTSNSFPTFVDVDSDGDLDAFLNIASTPRYYRNNSGTLEQVMGTANPFNSVSGVNTPPTFADVDSDGDLDVFISTNGTPRYYRNNFGTLGQVTGTANPFNGVSGASNPPTFVDMDSDGDLDAFLSTNGTPRYYRNNSGTLGEVTGTANPLNGVSGVNTSPTFADVDKDGDLDAFLSTNGTPRYYRNNSGTLGEVTGTTNPFNGVSGVNIPPTFVDVDSDGDLDAFLSTNGTIRYYRNNSGTLGQVTGTANPFNNVSGVNNPPTFADVDKDGDLDAFLSTNGAIRYYRNNSGTLGQVIGTANPFSSVSLAYNPPTFADVDKDGDLDAFITNSSGVQYFQNTTPIVTIAPGITPSEQDPNTPGTFILTLSTPAPTGGLTINYTVGGRATSGVDYQPLTGSVIIPQGATTGLIPVTPIIDNIPEVTENISVSLRTGTGYNIGATSTAILGITNFSAAPVLAKNASIAASKNSRAIITSALLQATDSDNTPAQLTYTLTSLPGNGTLELNGNRLTVNGTFTQEDINNNRLTYLHNSSSTTSDQFGFTISDGIVPTTTRVSVDSTGTQGNNNSYNPLISADGRYVTFESSASNLVSGDTNGLGDIFVRDLVNNTTTRVSVDSTGTQGNNASYNPSISADGRYVTFESFASNLVSGDTNGLRDIFVRDLAGKTTTRVSVASTGTQSNNDSYNHSISADGRYVTFESFASNLVSGDTNGLGDIFVRNLVNNTTTRVSVASTGTQGNNFSHNPSISADGRYVTFRSLASNLVSGDTNGSGDIFVRDLVNNTTTRVSVDSTGTQGNSGDSYNPSISADGRYVTFESFASNLVSEDTNGLSDIFVRDLVNNITTLVSVDGTGTQGNSSSYSPSISADGRYVTFESFASNLVSGDTNGLSDIFVRDLGVSGNSIAGNSTVTINAAPTDVSLSATSVDENVVANTVIGTFSSTDPDVENTFVYTLVDGTGSINNNIFSIVDGNQLRINTSPNYEAKNSYNIRVRTTDSGGLRYEKSLTINVNNVNETPTDLNLSATSINKNAANNTVVGNFSTSDPDANNTFTYSLVSGTSSTDNSAFSIDGNELRINTSPNLEAKNSYNIRVRTTDSGGLSYEEALTINVNNVNEAPVLVNNVSIPVSQNSSVMITSALLQATDSDNTPAQLTYTLTSLPSNGMLQLNGTALAVNRTFTQEDINNNRLTYQHNGSNTTSDAFGFTVTDGVALTTTRISVDGTNIQGNGDSYQPSISADGRYVTFMSSASNLVSGDTNDTYDIFLRDLITNTTTRVSVDSTGIQGNGYSYAPSISADGRYVTFYSRASNLVSWDTNGTNDIFVRDLVTNTTTRVSVDSTGIQGNGSSENPSISADGRYVTFESFASHLVSGDINFNPDIFVRDRETNTITLVSVDSTGTQGNSSSFDPSISADGRYVTFYSNASNLVSEDTNGTNDIFVRDLVTNTTTRVSVDSTGTQGNGYSYDPSISADGRYVTFRSHASNLVSRDTNGTDDIFVRDLVTNTTTRVSVDSTGIQGNGYSYNPSISADGRYVTFRSLASNLVSRDTNGTNDIFVRDLVTNTTTRVSVDSTGIQGNGSSENPFISANGRYVTFSSNASNLVSGDTNGKNDIFVRGLGGSGKSIASNSSIVIINATPTDLSLSATSVNENVAVNTVVGTFSTTDPDTSNTFTYNLVDGIGSTDNNTFSIVDGNQLRINTSPNFEAKNSYNIRVRTTNSGGLSYEEALIINVNNLNETPTDLNLSATSVNENVAANTNVGILSTADSDTGNTFTYNLVPGTGSADNGNFSIVNGNQLRITRSPNFETKNSYNIRVRTTDSGGLSYEKALTIGVNNVNETPIDLNLSATSINENVAANTVVGTLFSADLDTGNTFTYSLVPGTGSTDNSAFSIVGNELQINTSVNFEAKPNYNIRVRTTDQGGLSHEKALTINVNDVNETPTDLKLSATSVNENVATNIIVGTFSTNDSDTGNTFTYTLVDGTDSEDNNAFSIVNGNQLRINTSTDYETKSSYNIRVRTTDQGGLSYEKALIINVNDVNENSTGISLSANSVDENVAANTIIGTLVATNPGSNNTFTYELISGAGDTDNSAFSIIDGSNLRLNSSPNYEDKNSYNIRVASTNSEGLSYEEELTINVNNLNETPTLATPIADQTATVGSVFNYTFPDTTFSDVDGDSLIYTSTVPDWLNFNPATRTFSGTPSSSNQGVVEIPVIASDRTSSISDTFSLTVFPATPPTVTLSLDNSSFAENGGTTTVTATLTRAITSDVTVGLGLGGSASSTDYTTSSSQIVINAGSTSGTTTLTALDDNEFEGGETVVIDILSVINGAELNTQQVSAAILDDDTAPIGDTSGDDTISGTPGNDRIILTTGINTVRAGNGSDVIAGGTDRDILYGDAGNDIINGNGGNDDFYGGEDNDIISGDVGDDRLYGDAGSDRLFGGAGIDRLYGGTGDDLLDGGVGADPLNGGSGADIFVLRFGDGRDTIQDYTDESDKIGLAAGLSFAQLQFTQQVVTGVGVITQIAQRDTNEVLATLVGISSSSLTTSDFVSV